MKRLAVTLAAMGLTASVGAYAAMPTGAQATEVTVPQEQPGFFLGLTGLYYQPSISGDDLRYAIKTTNAGTSLEHNEIHNIDPGYHFGFEVFGGYDFGNGNDVALSYLRLHTDDTSHVSSVEPGVVNGQDGGRARGKVEVNLDQVDLVAGQYVNIGCAHKLHLLAGLRYARLTRDLHVETFNNIGARAVEHRGESHFKGIGPLVGVNGNYYLGYGVGLVAAADTALLVGKIDADHTTTDASTSPPQTSRLTDDMHQVVPVADAKLGLDYTYPFQNYGSLTLEAGYHVSHYWNAIDNIRGIDVTTGSDLRESADVGYKGPYVTLTYRSTPTA